MYYSVSAEKDARQICLWANKGALVYAWIDKGRGVSIDPVNIPGSLRFLLPLAKRWAIADDKKREDFLRTLPFAGKEVVEIAKCAAQPVLGRFFALPASGRAFRQ